MEKQKNLVEQMIVSARNHLLDTSFNNRMINSKITLNKGLSFSVENLDTFYKLVINNNSFSFLPLESKKADQPELKKTTTLATSNTKVGTVHSVHILSSTNKPSLVPLKMNLLDGDSHLVYEQDKEEGYVELVNGLYAEVKKNFTKYAILQDNIYNKNIEFTGFKKQVDLDVESASLSLYLSILSCLREEGVPQDYVFIGGINSKKEITQDKEVVQKVLFAHEKGMSKIFVSKRSKKDIKAIEPELLKDIEVIYLTNLDEAIVAVFEMVNVVDVNSSSNDFVVSKPNQPKKVFYVNYNRDDLKLRTEKIYYDSKRHIEEQGVNILFLSFGFVQWQNPLNTEETINSPLIFVPVNIDSSNYKSLFEISFSNSEILLNKSLIKKLEVEHNLNLESLELNVLDETEFNPLEFIDNFHTLLKDSGIKFDYDFHSVHLSFYSYNKFLIYNDLDPIYWEKALDGSKKNVLTDIFVNNIYHEVSNIDDDKLIDNTMEIDNIHNVVDADSSQLLAVSKVNRGNSIIIQGPPGTGKSQTIVNIIAEGVRRGKKVLFMSEKLAAMEVVYNRLRSINLDHIALRLHSDKVNKKQVVSEIQDVYYMNKINVKNIDPKIDQKLRDARTQINQYYSLLNTSALHSKMSIIEAYQDIIELENYFDQNSVRHYELEIPNQTLMEMSDDEYSKLHSNLEILENFNEKYDQVNASPLYGVDINETITHHDLMRYSSLIKELLDSLNNLNKSVSYSKLPSIKKGELTIEDIKHLDALRDIDLDVLEYIPYVDHPKMIEKKADLERVFSYYLTSKEVNEKIKTSVLDNSLHLDQLDELNKELDVIIDAFKKHKSIFKRKNKNFKDYKAKVISKYFIASEVDYDDAFEALIWLQNKVMFEYLLSRDSVILEKVFSKNYNKFINNIDFLINVNNNVEKLFVSIKEILSGKDDNTSLYIDYFKHFLKQDVSELNNIDLLIKKIETGLHINENQFYDGATFTNTTLLNLNTRFNHLLTNIESINDVIVQRRVKSALESSITDAYLLEMIQEEKYPKHISKVFEYIRCHSIVKEILNTYNTLDEFNSLIFDKKIREFVYLDSKNIQMNNLQEVLDAHFYNVYNIRKDETLSVEKKDDRISYLLQTFNKKRNIPTVKQLLHQAFEPITELKPVFMMSPISISQYLEPIVGMFDIVVFDEASQIKPQDAFGALLRGKQIVVVGDEKQLPPTNFFESFYGSTEFFEEDAISNYESILTLLRGRGVPTTTLNWHYRSKHHNLIQISNDHFYDNSLSIYPSRFKNNPDYGLKYVYVDGVFDRGRSRTNIIEAKLVAQEVINHAKNNPELSLGVATVNISQRDLIMAEVKRLRSKEPELDSFFLEDKEEAFFIKNLENVQGDEREVIFVSIGYGKDQNGNIIQNFGAINHQGGERRLNVLMTRARQKCVIYSGLRASDLEMDYNTTDGVKVLRKFLAFAEKEATETEVNITSETKIFAEEIAKELNDKGYKTSFNIGNSQYFIDLAVHNPENETEYILGIEFDYSSYNQSRTATERERIRNNVMRSKGWIIYKVFITSWFNNRKQVLDDIFKYLEHTYKEESNGKIQLEFYEESVNVVTRFGFKTYKKYTKMIENIEFLMKDQDEFNEYVKSLIYKEMPVTFNEIITRIVENSYVKIKDKKLIKPLKKALRDLHHDRIIYSRNDFYYFHKKDEEIKFRDRRNSFTNISITDISIDEYLHAIKEITRNSFGINTQNIASIISNYLGYEAVSEELLKLIEQLAIRLENTNVISRDLNNNLQVVK